MKYLIMVIASMMCLYFCSNNMIGYLANQSWLGNDKQLWLFMLNSLGIFVTGGYLLVFCGSIVFVRIENKL